MNTEIEQIILRNLSGQPSYEDILLLSEWLSVNEENKQEFLRIKKYWDAEVSLIQVNDPIDTYKRIAEKIHNPDASGKSRLHWNKKFITGVAALFTGVILCMGILHFINTSVETYTYVSGTGVSKIDLPDGTQVSLNKNSKLHYTNQYGKKNRHVSLEGEAYFEVKGNKKSPFIVDLNQAKVTVLGTVFDAKSEIDNNIISTVLIEGSVRFETPTQTILLKPGQQVSYDKASDQLEISNVETDILTAWKDNLIKYRNIRFDHLTQLLESHYNVKIEVLNQELASQVVSGTFESNLGITSIMDLMKTNLSFQWSKQEDTYSIK